MPAMTGGCGRYKMYFDRIITMTDGKIIPISDHTKENLPGSG
jgi:flagellar motor switch/type III secretory pathway protein FliN